MSKRFDYGLILIERLKKGPQEFLDVRTIAKEHKIPAAYLEKIAQEFKRLGWLESRRGFGGGYRLVRAVSVSELIQFFEKPYQFCPLGKYAKNLPAHQLSQ